MSVTAAPEAREAAEALLRSLDQPDPYPAYARLRRLAPVYVPPEGPVLLTSYRAVWALLHSPLAGKNSDTRFRQLGLPNWREHAGLRMMYDSILQLDEPDHTRLRRLVSKVFTGGRSEALRSTVRAAVATLIDRMRERSSETIDLMAAFAFPLPVTVIGELVGVPPDDRPQFADRVRDLALSLEPGIGPAEIARCDAAAEQLDEYFHRLVAERRRAPTSDLASALAAQDGFVGDELIVMLVLLFAAGFETTTHLLGNSVVALANNPDQVARLRGEPALTTNAVEELLRYDSPVQLNSRVLAAGIEVDGNGIPPHRPVFALLGAANRDPDRYSDPDRLDLGRRDIRSMSFGGGAHFCLGAALARIEVAEALPALHAAFEVEPAGDAEPRPGLALRGLARLPVRVTAR
jgi:cytochrome P450